MNKFLGIFFLMNIINVCSVVAMDTKKARFFTTQDGKNYESIPRISVVQPDIYIPSQGLCAQQAQSCGDCLRSCDKCVTSGCQWACPSAHDKIVANCSFCRNSSPSQQDKCWQAVCLALGCAAIGSSHTGGHN